MMSILNTSVFLFNTNHLPQSQEILSHLLYFTQFRESLKIIITLQDKTGYLASLLTQEAKMFIYRKPQIANQTYQARFAYFRVLFLLITK